MSNQSEKAKSAGALQKARKTIKKRMFSYIAAGLGLVAGLAWNDAIKFTIDHFLPTSGGSVIAKLSYATVLTFIVGSILFYVEKHLELEDE